MRRRHGMLAGSAGTALVLTGLLLGVAGRGGFGTPPAYAAARRDDGGSSAAFLALLPVAQQGAAYVGNSRCGSCHTTGVNGAPVVSLSTYTNTEMGSEGVRCEHCHGPGSAHAAAPSKLNILTYPNVSRHEVCTQCHEDQGSQYSQSKHSVAVADAVVTTTTNYAQRRLCLRCHSSPFRMAKIDVPLSKGQTADAIDAAIGAMAYEDIAPFASATVESPSCANCHDPHKRTPYRTWTGDQKQLRRSVYNTDVSTVLPGAPNKAIVTYNHLCAGCHMGGTSTTASGTDAALKQVPSRPNMHDNPQFYMLMGLGGAEAPGLVTRTSAHATVPGQCSHCHIPDHNHAMVPDYEKSCEPCHSSDDARARAYRRQSLTAQRLASLKSRLDAWSVATYGQPGLWDYTALIVAGTPPDQTTLPIQILRARHNYYMDVREGSLGIHNRVYSSYLLDVANANLDALGVPKVASTMDGRAAVRLMAAERKRVLAVSGLEPEHRARA